MSYIISVDSTTDLLQEDFDRFNFVKMPLSVNLDGNIFYDGQMDPHEFYDLMRSGKTPLTSQVNVNEYVDAYTPYLKDGKDILALSFSSALSGTFNSLRIAKEMLEESFPERKIIIIDSLCASMGEGLLAYYAGLLYEKGKSIDEVAKFIEENKLNIHHIFTVEDLVYLKRGGRVSGVSAFIAKTLKIKPVLYVDLQGRLIAIKKVIGRKSSLNALFEMTVKYYTNKNDIIFISHGDCLDDAKKLGDMVKEKLAVKEIKYNNVGAVIGAHSGPGTLAIFYLSDSQRSDR